MNKHVFVFTAILSFFSCGKKQAERPPNDRELARVHKKSLWLSDMEGMFHPGQTPSDSATTIATFVQNWVRTELMEYEAERNIPSDFNTDALVRDYRASLMRLKYEDQIFSEKLDTTIPDEAVRKFYEEKKDAFILPNTMVRCLLIKTNAKNAGLDDFEKIWEKSGVDNLPQIKEWCSRYAVSSLLDVENWYNFDEITAKLPKNTFNDESVEKGSREEKEDGFKYFVRILEVAKKGEPAPFEQAKSRIKALIRHGQKIDVIEKWQDNLYEQELRRNNVKIF